MSQSEITVIDVMRDKKVHITNELSWQVGAQVRDRWIALDGNPPELKLTPKTNGPGTHCIARYPEWFRPCIEDVIDQFDYEQSRQGEFDW